MFSLFRAGLQKIRSALSKTRSRLFSSLRKLFGGPLSAESQEELERILYEADFGVASATSIAAGVTQRLKGISAPSEEELLAALQEEILPRLPPAGKPIELVPGRPTVVLIAGVNGNGKTTTIAKLAKLARDEGRTVLLAAADTFRAAAIDQLQIWAERLGCEFVRGPEGGDPAAVAYDGCQAAMARGIDLLLIDTAGRLQNKEHLMHELAKIRRVCGKALPDAPHETLLVIDATTGQNALDQAKAFHSHTPLSGLILTKLDGTAKGGMAVALWHDLKLPLRYLGTGEGADDFELFNPTAYLEGLLAD